MSTVDGARLKASLLEMAAIGATPAGGVTRLALSEEDRAARDLFAHWARGAGLTVRIDDLGSMYARLAGSEPSLPPVLIGSHLDSVPLGGKFDGPLGVLAGRFAVEDVYARRDRDGLVFEEELRRIGYLGDRANRPVAVHAYLELHIEQGPVLEAEGLPVAAVDGVLGIRWYEVTLTGQAQHQGPSPMRTRRDAMVAAARIVHGLRDLMLEYPDPAVGGVGRIRAIPGVMGMIPGQVVLGANVRHFSSDGLAALHRRFGELVGRVAAEERVEPRIDELWHIEPTHFDPNLVAMVEEEIRALGVPVRRMTAGAGHDAQYVAGIAPAAMIFVRTIGGMSHVETEAIEWEDATLGAEVMLGVVRKLAER
jgi:N-carbamoyl-L-amino-acid hydrolase